MIKVKLTKLFKAYQLKIKYLHLKKIYIDLNFIFKANTI